MKVLNIGIVAHVDAGKTTLSEDILFKSGVIQKKGRVDDASTVTDDLSMERARGITIKEKTVSFVWQNMKINLLDTPGHMDFYGEVIRACRVLDVAILVISAKEGLQTQTVAIHKALERLNIPIVYFVNKIDRIGADPQKVIIDLQKVLGAKCVRMNTLFNMPGKILESRVWYEDNACIEYNLISMCNSNEKAVDMYLSTMNTKNLIYAIHGAIQDGYVSPLFIGIATKGIGVSDMLNCLSLYYRNNDYCETLPTSALIYKITSSSPGNNKIYFRVYQGTIHIKDRIKTANSNREFRINTIEMLSGNKLISTKQVTTGDIGVLTNIPDMRVGDILGISSPDIQDISLPPPTQQSTIHPKTASNRQQLIAALHEISISDSQISYMIDPKTSEIKLNLCGDIHKEFIRQELHDKYAIDVYFSRPIRILKETPCHHGSASIHMGDPRNTFNASIKLDVCPLPRGSGIHYESCVSYGYITESFQNAVADGVMLGLQKGPLQWEVTDISVKFVQAYFDSVTSTPSDFRNLAPLVLAKALEDSGTVALYPQCDFIISLDNQLVKDITAFIHKTNGNITSITSQISQCKVGGNIPEENLSDLNRWFYSHVNSSGSIEIVGIRYE